MFNKDRKHGLLLLLPPVPPSPVGPSVLLLSPVHFMQGQLLLETRRKTKSWVLFRAYCGTASVRQAAGSLNAWGAPALETQPSIIAIFVHEDMVNEASGCSPATFTHLYRIVQLRMTLVLHGQ